MGGRKDDKFLAKCLMYSCKNLGWDPKASKDFLGELGSFSMKLQDSLMGEDGIVFSLLV